MGELESIIKLNYEKHCTEVQLPLTTIKYFKSRSETEVDIESKKEREKKKDREKERLMLLTGINKDLLNESVWADIDCEKLAKDHLLRNWRARQ